MNMNEFWMGDLTAYLDINDKLQAVNQARLDGKISEDIVSQPLFMAPFGEDEDEEEDQYSGLEYMVEIQDGVAILNIEGGILTSSSWFTRWLGIPTHQDIQYVAGRLDADPSVNSIIVNLATPGGSAMGINEGGEALTKVMMNGNTSIKAHTSTMCASAGLWYACSVKDFTAAKMALVGSLGVIQVHMEISKQLKAQGVEVHVFREGKFKALLNSFEPLTDLAIQENEKKMRFLNDQFIAQVSFGRSVSEGEVRENMGEGREFFGVEALRVGLVDSITSMEQVVNKLKDEHNDSQFNSSTVGGIEMSEEQQEELNTENSASPADEDQNLEVQEDTTEQDTGQEEESSDDQESSDEELSTDKETDDQEQDPESSEDEQLKSSVQTNDPTLDAVVKLSAENESLKAKLSLAQSENNVDSELMLKLTEACMLSISRMEIALSVGSSSLDAKNPSTVLETFNSLNAKYTKSFKIGSSAEEGSEEDEDTQNNAGSGESSVSKSRQDLTTF